MDGQPGHRAQGSHGAEARRSLQVVAGGSFFEALCGTVVVVLSVLGLLGVDPAGMLAVAVITAGLGLVVDGGAVAGAFWRFGSGAESPESAETLGGEAATQSFGGICSIILGGLALSGIDPMSLLPLGVIVLGVSLLFASAASSRLGLMPVARQLERDPSEWSARESLYVSSTLETIIGLASIILGTLALLGTGSLTLSLVAVLALGAATMLDGSSLAGRMVYAFR